MESKAHFVPDAADARRHLFALRVHRVVEETADARSFVLDVPEELKRELRYVPGQYLTVDIPWEGFRVHRCYSLSSAPEVDARPTVTVKRVDGGRVSNHLLDHVREGDVLEVHRPAGRFVLDPSRGDRPLVFFAGGSGITPIYSMIKSALASRACKVRMLYANRSSDAAIFAAELTALAARYGDRLSIWHHHDESSGPLTDARVRAFVGDPTDADYYLCGPRPFMDRISEVLRGEGVAEDRICVESFASPIDPDRRPPADASSPTADREAPESFLVTLGKKLHRVPYDSSRTLLRACQDAGVEAPSSCEDGFCGSCMCSLVEGDVDMANPLALTARDIERGRVLACQARATSRRLLHIDFDSVSFGLSARGDGSAPRLSPLRFGLVTGLCVVAALLVRLIHYVV